MCGYAPQHPEQLQFTGAFHIDAGLRTRNGICTQNGPPPGIRNAFEAFVAIVRSVCDHGMNGRAFRPVRAELRHAPIERDLRRGVKLARRRRRDRRDPEHGAAVGP